MTTTAVSTGKHFLEETQPPAKAFKSTPQAVAFEALAEVCHVESLEEKLKKIIEERMLELQKKIEQVQARVESRLDVLEQRVKTVEELLPSVSSAKAIIEEHFHQVPMAHSISPVLPPIRHALEPVTSGAFPLVPQFVNSMPQFPMEVFIEQRKWGEAIANYQQGRFREAAHYFETLSHPFAKTYAQFCYGKEFFATNQYPEAIACLKSLMTAAIETGMSKQFIALVYLTIGDCQAESADGDAAISTYFQAKINSLSLDQQDILFSASFNRKTFGDRCVKNCSEIVHKRLNSEWMEQDRKNYKEGHDCFNQFQLEGAKTCLSKISYSSPLYLETCDLLATVFYMNRELAKAAKKMEECATILFFYELLTKFDENAPRYLQMLYKVAKYCFEEGNYDSADHYLQMGLNCLNRYAVENNSDQKLAQEMESLWNQFFSLLANIPVPV